MVLLKSKNHVFSINEMHLFINYKPSNLGEEFAKDMYLLMFYLIGIESIDLFNLKPAQKGRVFYDRYKTGRIFDNSLSGSKPLSD